jgi:hypothetical protein
VSGTGTGGVRSIAEWLEMATRKLSAPAKERIRLELEAHFADGMESHLADGCPEAEAQAAALAELGDPSAAAKRFRREHLTEKEAKRVERMLSEFAGYPVVWELVVYGGTALFTLFFFFHHQRVFHTFHIPLSIVMPGIALPMYAGLATIGFFVARHNKSKPHIRLLVLIQNLRGGCLMPIPALMLAWGVQAFGWVHWTSLLFLAALISQTIVLVQNFLLWFKLGRVGTVGPEMPSRDARAS